MSEYLSQYGQGIEGGRIRSVRIGTYGFMGGDQDLLPTSIQSIEVFGAPRIQRITTVKSNLPLDKVTKEGDIYLEFDPIAGYADVRLADRDVERDPGFETAILLTLGSDKRAEDNEFLPDDSGYKGGWWGDAVAENPGDQIGWKGWLLRRAKSQNEVISQCGEYLRDGFQWMIDDGIISDFKSTVERVTSPSQQTILQMKLHFVRPGGQSIFYTFFYNWEEQLLKRG